MFSILYSPPPRYISVSPPLFFSLFLYEQGCPYGVMVKALDYGIIVGEFELQSLYYVHFRTNILRERYETPYSPNYALNSITALLLEGLLWY